MVLLVLSLLSAVSAQEYPKAGYIFSYAVEDDYSGNQFGHTENRHGGDTAGAYHVRLPDGRLQTVQYTVDHLGGYRATVLYEGGQTQVATAPAKFVHEPVVYSGGGGGGAEPYFSFSSPAPVQPHLSPAHNFINTPPPPAPPVHHVAAPLHLPSYRPRPLLRPLHHQPTYFTLPQEHITVFSSPPRPSPHLPPQSPPPPPPPPPSSAPPASPSPTHVAPANKHHLAFSVPLVKPPEHHKEDDIQTPDPYLVSEEELKGKTFDSPFWYPLHRHIIKGYRNKDRGDKEDHRDYKVI